MAADACDHVSEPRLRLDAIHAGGADECVERGGSFTSGIRSKEEPVFPAQSNLAFILPISGKLSSSNIVGTRFTVAKCGAF